MPNVYPNFIRMVGYQYFYKNTELLDSLHKESAASPVIYDNYTTRQTIGIILGKQKAPTEVDAQCRIIYL